MRHVKTHPFRIQWSLDADFEGSKKYLKLSFEDINETPFSLTSLSKYALRKGVHELVTLNDKKAFLEGLRIVHIARTWNWRALEDSGPHEVALPGTASFQCGMVEPNPSIDFGTWLEGIYIAMILRDTGAVKVYGEANPEDVVRYGQNTPDPWEIPYIKFLNGIGAFDTNIGEYLKDALKGSDPTGYNPTRADWMLHILSPLLELWAMVFTHNADRFNAKLYEQQKLRHDWHAALGEESGNSIMEYIDLAALAAVCYAHDSGMKIEVKSDYLPEFLVQGDFPKLEWPNPEWQEWPKA